MVKVIEKLFIGLFVLSVMGCSTAHKGAQVELKPVEVKDLTQDQKSARYHSELAFMYVENNQWSVALDEANMAIVKAPRYASGYSARALIFMGLKEFSKADSDFNTSLSIDANPETMNNYGWFLCQQKDYRKATEYFLRAANDSLYKTPSKAYYNAGVCSQEEGDYRKAQAFLEKANELVKSTPEVLFGLSKNFILKSNKHNDAKMAWEYYNAFEQVVAPKDMTVEQIVLGMTISKRLNLNEIYRSKGQELITYYPNSVEAMVFQGE